MRYTDGSPPMRHLTRPLPLRWLALPLGLAAALAVGACSAAQTTGSLHAGAAAQPRPTPRDVHGEALELLPPDGLLALRVKAAEARRSPHFDTIYRLAEQNAGEQLRALERELGFDVVRTADVFAFGLYPTPGAPQGADEPRAWPLLYARGAIDTQAILAAARARAPASDPLVERTVDGARVYSTRSRAYLFPAPDVVLVFEQALTRRVVRQLAGEEARSAEHDPRFAGLFAQVAGEGGTVQLAADTAALRAAGQLAGEDASTSSVERMVMRAELAADLRLRAAGTTHDAEGAQRIATQVDGVRQELLGRFEVRLLGLGRLLNQGVTAVSEGNNVRLDIDARADELRRVFGAAQLLQAINR